MQAGTLHSGRWWWRSQRCTGSVMPTTSTCSKPMYHGLLSAAWLCTLGINWGYVLVFELTFACCFLWCTSMFGVHWLCVVLQPQLKVQCICRTHANLRLSCWKVKLVSIQIICIIDHHGITDASSIITMSASVLCLDHRQFGQAKSRAPALCTRRGAAWMSMLLSIYFRGVRYVSVCYQHTPCKQT